MTTSTGTAATTSTASATWEGGLRKGKGQFSAKSGAFQGNYSFATRFQGAEGTNPEELIAAAHASCLSMALSAGLEKAGTPATRVTTTASATIAKDGDGFRIIRMLLEVRGEVPGMDQAAFAKAAEAASEGCPVSQALKGNVPFELDARLA
jgi:osmotically inducible protein OsmC